MDNYNVLVGKVMDFLDENNYNSCTRKGIKSGFKLLGSYLEQSGYEYTPETADEWFRLIEPDTSATYARFYRSALTKLCDMYETGGIRDCNNGKTYAYTRLQDAFKNVYEEASSHFQKSLSVSTLRGYQYYWRYFFIFLQQEGCRGIPDISYGHLIKFHSSTAHKTKNDRKHTMIAVSMVLRWLYEKERVIYGFSIILRYISYDLGCFWNDTDKSKKEKIASLQESAESVPPGELLGYCDSLKENHRKYGYGRSASDCITRTTNLLFLFLDINGFLYSPEISFLWFESVENHFDDTVSLHAYRRVLYLIAEQHRNGDADLRTRFRNTHTAFSQLPGWCMEAANDFLHRKHKEGLQDSTLTSYRLAVCRFCTYLCGLGMHSFGELTFSVIKAFNRQDEHRTPAGKNAYNGCIRKFLAYLGEKRLVNNPMLFAALSSIYAPRETIVVILSDDELAQLNEQVNREDSSLTLQKKAMLLLGLKMGLRASDIVSLEIGSIDWKNPSIRFIQKKTGVEVNLPMPAEVGNALYQYITKERRQSPNPVIFLSGDAPFEPLDSTACIRALHSALPDRNVPGSGFHVTRKTYATQLLRNGVGVDMVINALGQRSDDAVDRYLCVDDERMRLCPVSLSECGIGGWTHEK
ncbi:MAG: tyrosine-type recombinase/integrase [Butyrivibrio sp.]|nr:tyrosine-type recombinase/integrase [Butyrivibrio sp.]